MAREKKLKKMFLRDKKEKEKGKEKDPAQGMPKGKEKGRGQVHLDNAKMGFVWAQDLAVFDIVQPHPNTPVILIP